MTSLHPAAQQGFSTEAEAYARGRPDYPAALGGWLAGRVGLGPGKTVADVGAGTGKFTRLLLDSGATVIAVEPVQAMREQIMIRLPAVRALAGTAQAIPLPDGAADAIVCAQAFHWFAGAEALDEFRRVLKPGGVLGLVWNVRDESVDWVAALTDIITPYEGDAPRFHNGAWERAFPHAGFGPLEHSRFNHVHEGPAQQVIIDRFLSVSFIAALLPAEKDLVRGHMQALIDTHPALRGQDVIRLAYTTHAFAATRLE